MDQTSRISEAVLAATARAVEAAGGGAALARSLHLTRMAVQYWLSRGVPADRVLAVERITGVSRHDLRPDVFGADPDSFSACCSDVPSRLGVARVT